MVTLRRSPTGWWPMIPVVLWCNYVLRIPPCNGPLGHVRRSTRNHLEPIPACRPSDPQNGVPDPRSGVRGPRMGPIWDPSRHPSTMRAHRRHSGEPSLSLVPWWPLCGAYRPSGQRRLVGHGQELARTYLGPNLGSQIMSSPDPEDQISGSGPPDCPIWGPKMDTPGDPKSGVRRWSDMASNGIPRYGMSPLMAPWAMHGHSMGFHGARSCG